METYWKLPGKSRSEAYVLIPKAERADFGLAIMVRYRVIC